MSMTAVARLLAETTGLRYRMLTMCAPSAIACPRCGAEPGHECMSNTGHRPLSYHAPRRRLIAAMQDDDALKLLLGVYENLAIQISGESVWAMRAEILRQLLTTIEDDR